MGFMLCHLVPGDRDLGKSSIMHDPFDRDVLAYLWQRRAGPEDQACG